MPRLRFWSPGTNMWPPCWPTTAATGRAASPASTVRCRRWPRTGPVPVTRRRRGTASASVAPMWTFTIEPMPRSQTGRAGRPSPPRHEKLVVGRLRLGQGTRLPSDGGDLHRHRHRPHRSRTGPTGHRRDLHLHPRRRGDPAAAGHRTRPSRRLGIRLPGRPVLQAARRRPPPRIP